MFEQEFHLADVSRIGLCGPGKTNAS